MAKYTKFRSDNLAGTHLGSKLVSLRMSEDLENGSIVLVGALEAGEREVKTCTAPTAGATIGQLAILGSEEVVKNVKYDTVGDFINLKDSVARGYVLTKNDVFAVTAKAFTTAPEVGAEIGVAAGSHKMVTDGEIKIGKCIAIEPDGATTWYVVEV